MPTCIYCKIHQSSTKRIQERTGCLQCKWKIEQKTLQTQRRAYDTIACCHTGKAKPIRLCVYCIQQQQKQVGGTNTKMWRKRCDICAPPREPIAPHSLSPHIISSICKSSETRNIMRMQLRVSESGIGVVTMRVGESGIKVGRIKRVGESGIKVDRMNLPVKAGVRMFRRDASVMSQKPIS